MLTFTGNAPAGTYYIYLMAEDRIPVPRSNHAAENNPMSAVPVHLSLTGETFENRNGSTCITFFILLRHISVMGQCQGLGVRLRSGEDGVSVMLALFKTANIVIHPSCTMTHIMQTFPTFSNNMRLYPVISLGLRKSPSLSSFACLSFWAACAKSHSS